MKSLILVAFSCPQPARLYPVTASPLAEPPLHLLAVSRLLSLPILGDGVISLLMGGKIQAAPVQTTCPVHVLDDRLEPE